MIVTADKYEKLLKAVGTGSWGRLDFEEVFTNLRVLGIRQMDGSPKIYFDGKREQVLSGVRYQPVARIPYRLIPGQCYKVMTHVEFVKPIPKGMVAMVVPTQDTSDAAVEILSAPIAAGFKGPISFTVTAHRSLEIDQMAAIGRLMMFDSKVPTIKKPVKSSSNKKKEEKDEDSSPSKSGDGGKADS